MFVQISNLDNEEMKKLYFYFRPIIEEKYKGIKFTKISDETYQNIVNKALKNALNSNKNDNIDQLFMDKLNILLNQYIKYLLNNSDKWQEVTINYLKTLRKNAAKVKLTKVISFWKMYNFYPDIDLCIDLLKQKEFNKVVAAIVETNISKLKKVPLTSIFKDEMYSQIISTYCMINNIKIAEENIDEEKINRSLSKMTNLDYKQMINTSSLLTDEEIHYLKQQMKLGDKEARNIFITHNLKLVAYIANKYSNRGLSFDDLFGYGTIGLITAVDRFDETKGCKFTTYAFYWIKVCILRSIYRTSKSIRIPENVYGFINQYNEAVVKLLDKLKRHPSIKELAKELNVSEKTIETIIATQNDTISFEQLIPKDNDNEPDSYDYERFLPVSKDLIEQTTMNKDLKSKIDYLINHSGLLQREKEIIKMRYGIDCQRPLSLVEIGLIYNITKERVRQIETNGLRKLRQYIKTQQLAIYTDNPKLSLLRLSTYNELYEENKKRNRFKKYDELDDATILKLSLSNKKH